MKKTFVLMTLILCLISSNISFASTYNVNTLKRKISKRERKTHRETILFHYGNLKNANLKNTTLYDIEFYKTNFEGANLEHTEIIFCDFEKTNLKNVDFSNTDFKYMVYIQGVSCVEGANFKNAKGLSNREKQFLRKNGAINVPANDPNECTKLVVKTAAIIAATYGIYKYFAG